MTALTYRDFENLITYEPELAQRVKENISMDIWKNKQITLFQSLKDYALFELEEGKYSNILNDTFFGDLYYPNFVLPFQFLDFDAFAKALVEQFSTKTFYDEKTGYVLTIDVDYKY